MLAYKSRGVELQLRGLKIEHLLATPTLSNSVSAVPAEVNYLDDMLQSVHFSAAIIDEEVLSVLTEDPTEHADTEDDTEKKLERE